MPRRQRRTEPRWLTRAMLAAIHQAQIREHGGLLGVRDEALIESALARPRHKFEYESSADLPTLAAAYAFGLTKNHEFVDGNKRTGFMGAYVFLGLNGYDLNTSEPEIVAIMQSVAAGTLSEIQLAAWMRETMVKLRTRKRRR